MAPSGRRTTRSSSKVKAKVVPRKPRRTHYKKRLRKPKKGLQGAASMAVEDNLPYSSSFITSTTSSTNFSNFSECLDFDGGVEVSASACSTPKAQRFRIPEIVTCPPAPKKQRMIPNCSLQRRPIAFFAPPDIELFFFALHDVSV